MSNYNGIKVSVILPSLNVVNYIDECISSVVNQSLKDIEIICVDAGSTDGTLEIIEGYARIDSRIKVINSDIKSYGYQMNIGIDSANGEYIGIVETDDLIPSYMYEELYSIAHKNDVDIVKADFYRFTGDGENRVLSRWVLTNNEDMYNRVIDVQNTEKCFSLLLNTWCGIYRREYLGKNGIKHNESLGASYQDNGFWFQSLIYANTAYFVDKPYYMNRRDNAGSSVYNSKNAFKIFDEFRFIWDRLSQDTCKLEKYKREYGIKACSTYLYFLNNTCKDAKLEFIKRFSEEIKWLRDIDAFPIFAFNSQDLEVVLCIANNPEEYYESVICEWDRFEEKVREYETVIIYGAGMIGRRLYNRLKIQADPVTIHCFAVTNTKADNKRKQDSVPVCNINELVNYKDSALIIVAVSNLYKNEMVKYAEDLGFKNVICIPEIKEPEYISLIAKGDYGCALEKWYKYVTSIELDLNNPADFSQLQQALLISDNVELQKKIADRLCLKEYVKTKVGEQYVVPTLGVYNRCDDIDFEKYGRRFLIVNNAPKPSRYEVNIDYKEYNRDMIIRKVNAWQGADDIFRARFMQDEFEYRLLIEPSRADEDLLIDHNYYAICINGNVAYYMVVTLERFNGAHIDFFNVDWTHADLKAHRPGYSGDICKPVFLDEMKSVADIIAKDFRFIVIRFKEDRGCLRVDEMQKTLFGGVVDIESHNADKKLFKALCG